MIPPGPFDALDDLTPEELRQRLRSLQSLLQRAPVPIAIAHDPRCEYVSANRAAAELLRLSPEDNVSLTPPGSAAPPYRIQRGGRDLPADELPMQYAMAHRVAVRNEIEIVRHDGTVVYVQNDVEPLYDTHGAVYGCVSVFVDVTDRKLAEMALLAADRRKDEFLATLSHELRNPLAPLRTALEVMRMARDDAEMADKARATMERQLLHLVRITDDLLDVARITQSRVELRRERHDLRSAIHSALETIRPVIDRLGQTLTVAMPPAPVWIDADYTRLSQVFSNLLSNAVKYTDESGIIRVSAAVEGGWAVVAVADSGIGIEPELLPRVFEMFTQLQPHRDRTHSGLGIGLTLAKRLVELHGGVLEARSEGAGRGSTFIVRLPLAPEAAAEPVASAAGVDRRGRCRILVVEDNPDAADMMRVMLELKGHEVAVAGDGARGVALAADFRPELAFVDIGMPKMDGYEVARRIRGVLGASVTLVALTGWGRDDDKRRSIEAGFDRHLTKPPDPGDLEALLASCGVPDKPPR